MSKNDSKLVTKLSSLVEGQVPDFVQAEHPVFVQFFYNELDSSFLGASIVTIIFGTLFSLSNLDHDKKLNLQQAFLLTALSWLNIAIFGSLPFVFQ